MATRRLHWASRLSAAAVLLGIGAGVLGAQEAPRDTVPPEVRELLKRLEALELRVAEQEMLLRQQQEAAMRAEEALVAGRGAVPYQKASEDQRQRQVSGIYGRPFVRRFGSGTALGGYVDLELQADLEEDRAEFDLHRFIPFIFAQINDRIHFGTELEFEHGAEEIKIEFAALDVAFKEWLNVRGGIVLSPLGKFNLIHDSPVNDLTERPLVARQLIPTTLSEAGVGLFGTLYPSELSVLTYEAYLVNGFDHDLVFDGSALRSRPNVRSGRGSVGGDNNANKAFVARLGYSPFLGLEFGGSLHTGVYAPQDGLEVGGERLLLGDERLTILALDGIFNRGPFEVLGEFARLSVDAPVAAGEDFATTQQGYYLQGNYHFGHGAVPGFDSSVFTAVVRWGEVDFDADVEGDALRRLTLGLNWRPVEETVFKFDYLTDWDVARESGEVEDARRRLILSLATYF